MKVINMEYVRGIDTRHSFNALTSEDAGCAANDAVFFEMLRGCDSDEDHEVIDDAKDADDRCHTVFFGDDLACTGVCRDDPDVSDFVESNSVEQLSGGPYANPTERDSLVSNVKTTEFQTKHEDETGKRVARKKAHEKRIAWNRKQEIYFSYDEIRREKGRMGNK